MPARLLCFVLILNLFSCKKENKHTGNQTVVSSENRILVLNEGNFMWNNASFDLLDRNSWEITADVFRKSNNKALGDVLQCGVIHDGTLWLVLNNSGMVKGLDTGNFKEKWTLNTKGSPRYIGFSGNYFWLTDIYSGYVTIYNKHDRTEVTRIKTGTWCEQIINDGGCMSVACTDGWLRRYDTLTFKTSDSFFVGKNLQRLTMDKRGLIWAAAADSGKSRIAVYNPKSKAGRIMFSTKSVTGIALTKNKDSVCLLGDGLYVMSVEDQVLPDVPVFSQSGANFYGIDCDPVSGKILIADAKDYVSKGLILLVDSKGNLYKSLAGGIIPASFVFY